MKIDLHIHTTASDGRLSPLEIVDYCQNNKIQAIAITDHDSISGLKGAIDYGKEKGIEVIPGIEMSCEEDFAGINEIHIVGLFIDYENKDLLDLIDWQKQQRELQKKKMIEKLNGLGYEISFEELVKEANGASFGRPHIARIISRKYNLEFPDSKSIFDKGLLSNGGRAYVSKEKLPIKSAINAIKNAGGIAILAHPGLCFDYDKKVIDKFIQLGGKGIEIDYCYKGIKGILENKIQIFTEDYKRIAKENNLLISGGSDFHEFKKGFPNPGDYGISESEFKKMKEFKDKTIRTQK